LEILGLVNTRVAVNHIPHSSVEDIRHIVVPVNESSHHTKLESLRQECEVRSLVQWNPAAAPSFNGEDGPKGHLVDSGRAGAGGALGKIVPKELLLDAELQRGLLWDVHPGLRTNVSRSQHIALVAMPNREDEPASFLKSSSQWVMVLISVAAGHVVLLNVLVKKDLKFCWLTPDLYCRYRVNISEGDSLTLKMLAGFAL